MYQTFENSKHSIDRYLMNRRWFFLASVVRKYTDLSQVARQLLPIVQEEADDGYLTDLGEVLRNDLSQIEVGVYRVLNREGNDIELDLDNNLLDS